MSMQDLFAEAVERLIAGESAASIVASYPAEVQDEINSLLAVIELTDQMAVQPAPARAPVQRQRARADFLQQAHTLRAEMEQALDAAEQAGTTVPPARATAHGATRARLAAWGADLRRGWRNFFDAPVLRLAPLAPLAAIVIAVYLATFWTVQSAKAALPGDVTYPLKQWVRQQRITLAPPEQRPEAVREAEEEIAAEARTLSAQAANRASLAAEYSEPMVYYGRQGNLLLVGPFLVAPNFQPDPNAEAFVPMRIDGDLEPGARVELVYRMLPGNPNVVQGVSVTVIEAPKPTPPPTAAPTPQSSCRRQLPDGWIPYAVRAGDSLASLAERSGTSAATIRRVNCLEAGLPAGAGTIYLPDSIIVRVTPPAMPSPLPTYTPWPTATLEPTATAALPTGTPEPPTAQPTSTYTPEETPEGTPPAATATPISTPDGTPTGDAPTAMPTDEPTSAPTVEPTGDATGEPTAAPTGEPTSAPTGEASGTPTGEPTGAATPEPTTAPTTEPTTEPTGAATLTPSAAPSATVPPATEPPATATPEPPATVQPTADEPTPEPPTPEPPTREPPTREPAPTRAPEPTQAPEPTRVIEPTPAPPEPDPPTPAPPAAATDDSNATTGTD